MKDNYGFPSQHTVEQIRKAYPAGTRVALVSMDDPYSRLKPGYEGTVASVDATGTIFVDWDCGSGLDVVYGVDHIKKI